MPKILLVEDNEMNRDMLSRRLVRNGFEVVVAVDGGQAVTMAAAEKPDLILMDMSLPVMDGLEATRQVKAAPETRSIPIIALTANALVEDREKALAAGATMAEAAALANHAAGVVVGKFGPATVTPDELMATFQGF